MYVTSSSVALFWTPVEFCARSSCVIELNMHACNGPINALQNENENVCFYDEIGLYLHLV